MKQKKKAIILSMILTVAISACGGKKVETDNLHGLFIDKQTTAQVSAYPSEDKDAQTQLPVDTPDPGQTQTPEPTPTSISTPEPTQAPTDTPGPATPEITQEPVQTPTAAPTQTPKPTQAQTPTAAPTQTPDPTQTTSPALTQTPKPTQAQTPTVALTQTPDPTQTTSPALTQTPAQTEGPTPQPTLLPQPAEVTPAPAIDPEGQTPYQIHGTLSVNGTKLTDALGVPYQLKGVSTHGIAWFPQYVNQETFRTLRDVWKINVVRLAMYTDEYGGYCVGDDNNRAYLKNMVYNAVDAATQLGLYVIVDWHVLRDCDPNRYADQAAAFFDETAARYADYGNVIYEICNEPNGNVNWKSIKSYAERIIPIIKAHDPDAVIIVGTPTWSQDVDIAAADPIQGYGNIMYALHFYADTHRNALRAKMDTAIRNGLPVFVSEYGICDASGSGAINQQQSDIWIDALNKNGISYCIWSLCNKAETASLLKPSTQVTSNFSYDELSDTGKWFVNMMGADPNAFRQGPPDPGQGSGGQDNNGGSGDNGNGGSQDNNGGNGDNGNSQDNGGGNGNGGGQSAPTEQPLVTAAPGQLQASLKLCSDWESGSKHCYQYTLEITNGGENPIGGWTCEITFSGDVNVIQSWCGGFESQGAKIVITPADFNMRIDAGQVRGDIGFILEADGNVSALTVECR